MWGFLHGESYRAICSLRVTVRHFGDVGSRPDTRTFTRTNLPQVIACLNPRCSNGGYDLTQAMRKLIEERPTDLQVGIACLGRDGAPKGRGRDHPCGNSIEVHLDPVYTKPGVNSVAHLARGPLQRESPDDLRRSPTEPNGEKELR